MEEQIIPLDSAFSMYDRYTNDRVALLHDILQEKYGKDFYDTRTVWFDIDVLEAYIRHVKTISKEKDVNAEGIKICFGVYPNTEKDSSANHQNVFLVPTSKKDDRQAAYTIVGDKVLFLMDADSDSKAPQKVDKAAFFNLNSTIAEGLILNNGTLIPPPYQNDPDFQ